MDASSAEADWAWLPKNILDDVLKKLGTVDEWVRFGLVCKPWFLLVSEQKEWQELSSPNRLPLLMIPAKDNRRDKRNLYDVLGNKDYDLQLTVRYNRRCCGSSHGWLASMGRNMVITLTDPVSGRRIMLPPIEDRPRYDITPDRPYSYHCWVNKVILSEDPDVSWRNCVVGAIYDGYDRLAFTRLDDECWSYVDTNLTLFDDMIFRNGFLYSVDLFGKLVKIDINIESYVGEDEVNVIVPRCMEQADKAYIVDSRGGDILMVRRFLVEQPGFEQPGYVRYLTRQIEVFKLSWKNEISEWIEVKSLDDEILFLGDNHSMSFSASDFPNAKPNQIFYTDNMFDDGHYKWDGPLDVGVLDMRDESFGSHYTLDPSQLNGFYKMCRKCGRTKSFHDSQPSISTMSSSSKSSDSKTPASSSISKASQSKTSSDSKTPASSKNTSQENAEHGGFYDVDGWCNLCNTKFRDHDKMIQHRNDSHKKSSNKCFKNNRGRRFDTREDDREHYNRRLAA